MTKQLTDRLAAVEVPTKAARQWMMESERPKMGYYIPDKHLEGNTWSESIDLPPGQWRIVGTVTDGVPDFDPEPYVGGNNGGNNNTLWRDYSYPLTVFAPFHCVNPSQSFLSLITSHSCHTGKWVIIEKV